MPENDIDLSAVIDAGCQLSEAEIGAEAGNTRLQNFACLAIPLINIYLASKGFPQIPLPAFCSTGG